MLDTDDSLQINAGGFYPFIQQELAKSVSVSISTLHDVDMTLCDEHTTPTENYNEAPTAGSFLARLTSVPLVQDGVRGTQAILQKHPLGRMALESAEKTLAKVQPYMGERWHARLKSASTLGHRSLDFVERCFPLLINTSSKDVLQAIHPHTLDKIKNHLCLVMHAMCSSSEPPLDDSGHWRIAQVIDNVEAVIDLYFPPEPDDGSDRTLDSQSEKTTQQHWLRVYHISTILSHRIAKRISAYLKTADQHSFYTDTHTTDGTSAIHRLVEQTTRLLQRLDQCKAQISEPLRCYVIEPLSHIVQQEYTILSQELEKPGLMSVRRAYDIFAASQELVVNPLLQRSVDAISSQADLYLSMVQHNHQKTIAELSNWIPILASFDQSFFTHVRHPPIYTHASLPTEHCHLLVPNNGEQE